MADDENSASSYTVSSNDLFCMHLAIILGHGSVDHGLTKAYCQILSVNRDFNVS